MWSRSEWERFIQVTVLTADASRDQSDDLSRAPSGSFGIKASSSLRARPNSDARRAVKREASASKTGRNSRGVRLYNSRACEYLAFRLRARRAAGKLITALTAAPPPFLPSCGGFRSPSRATNGGLSR